MHLDLSNCRSSAWTVSALAVWAACGGTSIVDGSGAGSASGGSGSATAPTGTDTTSSTSSGSGGTAPDKLAGACAAACEAFVDCAPEQKRCLERCLAGGDGACRPEYVAALQCMAVEIEVCSWEPECTDELGAWTGCAGTSDPCGGQNCAGDALSCSCEAQCGGMQHEILCTGLAEMPMCSCWVEGIYLGSCVPTSGEGCALAGASCCSALFPSLG